jgi:MbtH protein
MEVRMTVSLLDDENGQFYVVVNDEGQHAIWPTLSAVPRGWQRVVGPQGRQECLDYIEAHWTDMRPISLQMMA